MHLGISIEAANEEGCAFFFRVTKLEFRDLFEKSRHSGCGGGPAATQRRLKAVQSLITLKTFPSTNELYNSLLPPRCSAVSATVDAVRQPTRPPNQTSRIQRETGSIFVQPGSSRTHAPKIINCLLQTCVGELALFTMRPGTSETM